MEHHTSSTQQPTWRRPTLMEAFLPILFLIALLTINVIGVFGDSSVSGANQMALLFAGAVACLVAMRLGMHWEKMLEGMIHSITSAMPAMLILLLIGSLAGTWLMSGVVPAMIYYGLMLLNAKIFLVASCIICAIISIATGSSWTTAATIGVALLGIGKTLGIHEGMVAGAVISGAYFGDKISPLSDTTNLAPAMAGTDLFTHIRYMMLTTVPSISITLVAFLLIGLFSTPASDAASVDDVMKAIEGSFNITPLLFLVPVIVVAIIVKKMPALPALFIGTMLGLVFALIFQQPLIERIALENGAVQTKAKAYYQAESVTPEQVQQYIQNNKAVAYFAVSMDNLATGTAILTGNETIDSQGLLSSKGMKGMLTTVWLIICAMIFGGVMEASGLLTRITDAIMQWVHSTGSLIAASASTCIFFNITASDQYLAIVVPGRMFAKTYRERGLMPENLSRTLEDSGTVTSALIPWNTCGAYQASVLGVATGTYLPYCFFNIISPIMTITFGFLDIKIRRIPKP
jgi:NhaC family Na+:H+ antiporter